MKKDRISGIVIALLGCVVLVMSMQIPVKPNTADPGSGLFPLIGSIGMIICGLGIAITAKKEPDKLFLTKEGFIRLIKVGTTLMLYLLAISYLGFLISSPFMLYTLTSLFSYEKKIAIWKKIIFSLTVTALTWLVFEKAFVIMLPAGKLF